MPSVSDEDYLKAIFMILQGGEESAKTSAIAARLGVAPPSVTAKLRALEASGQIVYTRYFGATLSGQGRAIALSVVRKHRLIEQFLVEILDYPWSDVHEEAERLEHAVSDEFIARLDRLLGYPAYDPHGDPIPGAGGSIERRPLTPLIEVEPDTPFIVRRVLSQEAAALRALEERGVRPGRRDLRMCGAIEGGGVRLRSSDQGAASFSLPAQLARLVLVAPRAPLALAPGVDEPGELR